MVDSRHFCECVNVPFAELVRHRECTGASVCDTLCAFRVGEMCAACLADAVLALGGTERDMHEYLLKRLPAPPHH